MYICITVSYTNIDVIPQIYVYLHNCQLYKIYVIQNIRCYTSTIHIFAKLSVIQIYDVIPQLYVYLHNCHHSCKLYLHVYQVYLYNIQLYFKYTCIYVKNRCYTVCLSPVYFATTTLSIVYKLFVYIL